MDENLIYDVGFHNGDDTAYFLHRGFRVVAIEANPVLAKSGRLRFMDAIEAGRLTLLNVGISEADGESTFWIHEGNSEWSSFVREFGCRDGGPCHAVSVRTCRLASIVERFGVPLYMKVDIEGHDQQCLEGMSVNATPKYVSVELGPAELVDTLASRGFESFKIVNQKNHNEPTTQSLHQDRLDYRVLRGMRRLLHRNQSAGAQRDGSWRFPRGSSGPFGEDTNGRWLTYEATRSMLREHMSGRQVLQRGWFDVHARRAA